MSSSEKCRSQLHTPKAVGSSDEKIYVTCLHISCVCVLSRVPLFVTPWTAAHQAPLSMEFSRQEYWMNCHFLLQGIFLTQVSNRHLLCLLHCQADCSPLGTQLRSVSFMLFPKALNWCSCFLRAVRVGTFKSPWGELDRDHHHMHCLQTRLVSGEGRCDVVLRKKGWTAV